jgi:hypothetical protein
VREDDDIAEGKNGMGIPRLTGLGSGSGHRFLVLVSLGPLGNAREVGRVRRPSG